MPRTLDADAEWGREMKQQMTQARKLASKLQKAVNTGTASRSDMVEVEEAILNRLSFDAQAVYDHLGRLQGQKVGVATSGRIMKRRVKETLKNVLTAVEGGYSQLVSKAGKLDRTKLGRLVEIDTSISVAILGLSDSLARQILRRTLTSSELKDIDSALDDIDYLLDERRSLARV